MKAKSWLAFSIDRSGPTPIFEQICQEIRLKILSAEIAEGSQVPATRIFALELGVSRSTIVTAYEQLVAEGYLRNIPRSGYRVCAVGDAQFSAQPKSKQMAVQTDPLRLPQPFESGQPDMRLFPHRQWAKTISRICRTAPEALLVGGPLFGNLSLRQAIADHVQEWRGIQTSAYQVLITAGSMDALEICVRTLASATDQVGLENPGFLPVRHFVKAQGLVPLYLSVDRQGAQLPKTGTAPKIIILTPSHQYPLGGAMSPYRRQAFIQWAADHDAWILEDDYDSEFRYSGRPIPAMSGFDKLNRTIYIGSLSKIFSSALKLGFIILPEKLQPNFEKTLQKYGSKASYLPQQALADFMMKGEFYRHLRRMRRIYNERHQYLCQRLKQDFADYGYCEDHQAGMQIAFYLKPPYSDIKIAEQLAGQGVRLQALSTFCARQLDYNGFLLGFCGYSEAEMQPALTLIERYLKGYRAGPI